MKSSAETIIFKTITYLVILSAVVWFFYMVRDILLPFVLSGILAYVLSPVVTYFQTFGLRRIIVVLSLYMFFLAVFLLMSVFLFTNIIKEVTILNKNLPEYTTSFKVSIANLEKQVQKRYPVIEDLHIFDKAVKKGSEFANSQLARVPDYLAQVLSVLTLFVLIPIITFFFLLSGKPVINKIFQIVPSRYTETTLSLISEIDEILGSFLRGQFLESSCVGLLSIIGLLVIGVDYAVIIGSVAGLANMIPYLGPFVGTIPAVIVGIIEFGSISIVLKIVIMFALVQFIDNNIIQPIIFSKSMNIHPLIIIFAVISGAQIAGVMGMFLAVPIATMIKSGLSILIKEMNPLQRKTIHN